MVYQINQYARQFVITPLGINAKGGMSVVNVMAFSTEEVNVTSTLCDSETQTANETTATFEIYYPLHAARDDP